MMDERLCCYSRYVKGKTDEFERSVAAILVDGINESKEFRRGEKTAPLYFVTHAQFRDDAPKHMEG